MVRIFFSIHHGEQGDGSMRSQEVLDERDDHFKESCSEVEVDHHMVYEQEEILDDNVDDTYADPDESSHDSMAEFSIFLNPLFEEEVIEDSSEFTTFSNPLYEEDFPCSQIHQHHDEDRRPHDSSEDDETQDMNEEVYSEGETSFGPSNQQELCSEIESNMHGSENYPSIPLDQFLDKGEVVFPTHEKKQHLEDGADCVEKDILEDTCTTAQMCYSKELPFSKDHVDETKPTSIVYKDDPPDADLKDGQKTKEMKERNMSHDDCFLTFSNG